MKTRRNRVFPLTLAVILIAGSMVWGVQDQDAPDGDGFVTPKRDYQIEIDGKLYDLAVDQPMDLRLGEQTHRVTLRVKPFVMFRHQGLSFEYPQQFSCTLDQSDPTLLMWDISGGDASILLQTYEDGLSVEMMRAMLIPGVKSQFAGMRVTEEQAEFKYGKDEKLTGTRLSINMPDAEVIQEIYVFSCKGTTVSLWLQDARDQGGAASPEYTQLVEQLAKTLTIEK